MKPSIFAAQAEVEGFVFLGSSRVMNKLFCE